MSGARPSIRSSRHVAIAAARGSACISFMPLSRIIWEVDSISTASRVKVRKSGSCYRGRPPQRPANSPFRNLQSARRSSGSAPGQDRPAVMNQTLQPMGRYVQRGGIHRVLVAARDLGALRFENTINFILDVRKLGFGIDFPYSSRQGIKRIQRTFWYRGISDPEKFPCRGENRGDTAQNHGRQINFVAVFVHKTLLGAIVVGRCSWMYGKISIGVGAGSRDLRKDRLLRQQVPAHVHDGLREGGDQIGTELLVGNQI